MDEHEGDMKSDPGRHLLDTGSTTPGMRMCPVWVGGSAEIISVTNGSVWGAGSMILLGISRSSLSFSGNGRTGTGGSSFIRICLIQN